MFYIAITTDFGRGDLIVIDADAPITEAELRGFEISREDLDRCIAEGRKLMQKYGTDDDMPVVDPQLLHLGHERKTWGVFLADEHQVLARATQTRLRRALGRD